MVLGFLLALPPVWIAGICLTFLAPVLFVWAVAREERQQRRRWKDVLAKVPAYRQVLARYPRAEVNVRGFAPDRPTDVGDIYETED